MTITIVMEIITTLSEYFNDADFLSGLVSGCVSGVIVSLLSWYLTTRLLSPRLYISRDIAYEIIDENHEQRDENDRILRDRDGNPVIKSHKAYVYRIKLANESLHGSFDIKIFFRLRYNNHYATIQLPYLPYLNRKNFLRHSWIGRLLDKRPSYEHHRTISFRLTDIRLSKIEGFKNNELKQKHEDGVLNFNDFRKEDTIAEFVIMAVDSMSGVALRVVSETYTQTDLDKHVKEGRFLDGEMYVRTQKDSTSDE